MVASPTHDARATLESASITAKVPTSLFIGGEWTPAGDGATFPVFDPATEAVIADVSAGTLDDARRAVDAAAAAAPGWCETAPRARAEILRQTFQLMIANADWLAKLITLENGKALSDARAEVEYAAEFFRWYAEEAVRLAGSIVRAPSGANKIVVTHQPVGVCLLVTPWNFPAAMATRKIAPALAAGCTVILKPASDTPLTSLAIADMLNQAGAPPGVINVVPSRRARDFAATVLSDPRVRKVSFTGSTEVGKQLLAMAAHSVQNSAMELGGNAPFLVLADADLDDAVAGALVAKMRNAGQACTAANRFYVHASVAEEFARRLAASMESMQVGPGLDVGTDVGALINESAIGTVSKLVASAVDDGATVLVGGRRLGRRGYFYEPTVLADVSPDADILRHEIFGPVAPVVAYEELDTAIELANSTAYGLVSYVYTSDLARGMRISERLDSGMVGVNRAVVSDPAAPFGGVKESGIGREGGHDGLLEFTETKYVAARW